MKFKNYIETESGIKDTSASPGTAGQLLSSTVAGTSWIDQDTIHSGSSEVIDIQIKNISSANGGINLSKGDPVYIYGSVGASARLYVDLADADSTATNNLGDSKMPCVALLDQDLSPNGEGTATVVGKLRNLITNPIDGDVPNENDTVYVKSGGGLTLTKPTGSTNLIQNVGQVGRVSTSADGNIVVAALLRTNDVPNLPEGRLFVGTATNTSLTSDVVYVDDTSDRVGINTAMPTYDLDVDGAIRASEGFIDNEDNSALRVVSPPGGSFRSAFTTVGAIEVTIPNSYVKNDVTFTLEVREGGLTAYTIKIAMRGNVGIDLFPNVVSAYLTSDADADNNCTIKYDGAVPEFDDVKIYVQNPSIGFPSNTGVFITEFTVPATVADGNLAWGLNITSVPAEANETFSNTQVTNWKRNGQDLYYGSGSAAVGIGTTSPGDKLHVEGNIYLGSSASRAIYTGGSANLTFKTGGSGNLTFQNGTGNMLFLRSNGSSESMRIDSSGNVTMTGALTVNAKFTANDVDKHAPSVVYDADAGQVLKNEDSELAIGLGSVYPTSVNYPLWVQGRKNDDTARNICLQPVGGSVQIGVDNFNADKGSLATGYENEINGKFSFATGKTNVLGTSEATAAIGRLNEVTGLGSTAIGSNNTVTKKATVVIGSGNTANHENNFILGFANTTQKIQSIAVGRFNNLNSAKIVSVGHYNTSSGTTDNATSFGYLNESLHSNSHLFGINLQSSQEKEVVIGKNNDTPSNPTGPNSSTAGANVIIGVGTGQYAGANMNAVEYYGFNDGSMQVIHKALLNASSYANDTAAAAGGVPIGGLYRHNNDVKIRLT